MALRNTLRCTRFWGPVRTYSNAAGPLVNVQVDDKTGIATATLQRAPVNSLNLELLTEITKTLSDLEKNKARGVILTSSSNSVFSAGLDILEMYKPNPDRVKQFWSALQETWMKLYLTPYPTLALINGHSPAGGCLLSCSCEYRIMLPNFTIGLNETKLGIMAPQWFISSMKNVTGHRETELALTSGRLYKTDEALAVGLIDEVASTKEEGLEKALKFFQRFQVVNPIARTLTKKAMRGSYVQQLAKNRENDLQSFLGFVNDPQVQKGLEIYLEALKKKK